ncbi:unnamed protein product [Linum tenue]|uniref:DUF4283 domain-containing protein n=1 Tax=Linum tenue TaxID=586396 RepID=A0AAV0P661_9ROSI|nr:unnamed protein product [Linum tenue]
MLSTSVADSFLPAQALVPSGRPPDSTNALLCSSTDQTGNEAIAPSTDMAVEASPPPVVSQPMISYASAVVGHKNVTTQSPIASLWTPVGEHDLIPGERNGEPALRVSTSFKNKICEPWQRTLVVRLLGCKIGFAALCSRLRSLWRPVGSLEAIDLDHDCFLVKLSNEQDYFRALTDGPWVIYDHYLVVQQWTPNFKVSDPK